MPPDLLILCFTLISGFIPYSDCSSSASACAPIGNAVIRCMQEISEPDPALLGDAFKTTVAVSNPNPVSGVRQSAAGAHTVKAPAAAPTPLPKSGSTSADAMQPYDAWQTVGPKDEVWFRIGDEKLARIHMDVWLDAKGADGIGFEVYAPDQMTKPYLSGPPKGQGTRNNSDRSHDLNWSGNAPAGGVWYVRVTNSNPVPMTYKLGSSVVSTGGRANCTTPYWEWIGSHVNAWVLWPGYCS